MKNNLTKVLIGIALMFTAGVSYSEPVEYTFSTNGVWSIDPLLTELTSVSGSFIYENAAAPYGIGLGGVATDYVALSALSGSADGNSFSDPLGVVAVGNDAISSGGQNPSLVDIFLLLPGANFSGFTFAGMELQSVFMFWVEGQNGIGDFIEEDQSLPSTLPPTIAGLIELDFVDAGGVTHRAFFHLTVVAGQAVNTPKLNFNGQLDVVFEDIGGSIFSGLPVGTELFGEFDLVTALSTISDGTTVTPFTAYFDDGSFFESENDIVLGAEAVAYLNSLPNSNFAEGDVVDYVAIFGDAPNAVGGGIEIGLQYILNPLTFGVDGPDSNPPNTEDVLIEIFSIDEDDGQDNLLYSAAGVINMSSASIIWDESINGDLGNGIANLTNLGTLNSGSWDIIGDLDALPNFTGPDDIDTIEFTTTAPWTYDLVDWTLGTATGQGFFLLDGGNQTLAVTNELLPAADLFGTFPAGTYRLSIVPSSNVGTVDYTHRINVTSAEPVEPGELVDQLVQTIIQLNLQAGISNSLDAKLDVALDVLEDSINGNNVAALNTMYAFCNSVYAQRGKSFTVIQSDELFNQANAIIAAIDENASLCQF